MKELFVPDEIWPKFRGWHLSSDEEAQHKSILLLALERGHLSSITSSAHRYLLESGSIHSGVRRQYVNDLREQWMHHADPMERHHKFRMFFGRLVELQCAEWLEGQGWKVSALEAFREGPDIEATDGNREDIAFEVKYIGQDDEGFDTGLRSLRGEHAYGMRLPYGTVNYLLYRAYEAAKQLQRSTATARIALIVIDEVTWFSFETQLEDGWIDWKNPTFKDVRDPFIEEQRKRNPALDAELSSILGSIDAVWILKRSYGNQYARMFQA